MAEKTLPDRDTIEKRLEAARTEIYSLAGIVHVARCALLNENEECTDSVGDLLESAVERLQHLGGDTVDPIRVLAPAETQEVSHG